MIVSIRVLALWVGLFCFGSSTAHAQYYPPAVPPTYTDPDGQAFTEYSRNRATGQVVPIIGINGYANGFWAFATYDSVGNPIIIFEPQIFLQLPKLVRIMTFYHEVGHHKVPTSNEYAANAYALNRLRREGLTLSEEHFLADFFYNFGPLPTQYGGSGKSFWDGTIAIAGAR